MLGRTRNAILTICVALGVSLVVVWVWGSQFSLPPGAIDLSEVGLGTRMITDIASRRALVTDLTRAVKYLDPQHRVRIWN